MVQRCVVAQRLNVKYSRASDGAGGGGCCGGCGGCGRMQTWVRAWLGVRVGEGWALIGCCYGYCLKEFSGISFELLTVNQWTRELEVRAMF